MLSETMRNFITIGLSIDGGAPYPATLKNSWRKGSSAEAEIEEGLRELLGTRELTTLDWLNMTDVEFESEDELYSYLQKLYDYLFRGSEVLPEIPLG
jgi:hypothetical protein